MAVRSSPVPAGELVVAYDPVVGPMLIIRPARVQDVAQMARVHVRCWQETYRGLMPDAVLDDPGFPAARERMWTEVLTSECYRRHRVAVAERDGELAGIAMSGPPEDDMAAWARQLYVLYVYAADHGTGAGRGGQLGVEIDERSPGDVALEVGVSARGAAELPTDVQDGDPPELELLGLDQRTRVNPCLHDSYAANAFRPAVKTWWVRRSTSTRWPW